MNTNSSRREFLKATATAALTAPLVASFEESALRAQETKPTPESAAPAVALPKGTIGKVKLSRLICGGNLISGYAHSRDLIYVSPLLTHYFTDEKILETWTLCEQHGVNTMILFPADKRAAGLYEKYRSNGGRI